MSLAPARPAGASPTSPPVPPTRRCRPANGTGASSRTSKSTISDSWVSSSPGLRPAPPGPDRAFASLAVAPSRMRASAPLGDGGQEGPPGRGEWRRRMASTIERDWESASGDLAFDLVFDEPADGDDEPLDSLVMEPRDR